MSVPRSRFHLLRAPLPTGFASVILAATPAWAHAEHPSGETENLSDVVITAVHDRSPVQVVADPKQPRQPVPASDAADYLKTIPGFSAIRSGGSNSDPVFRGQFGSRLPILTNGSTMLGACGSRMDAPSAYISPETYDQLTVIKGPQTVLWGPGASAGVVRFDRFPPSFEGSGTRLSANVLGATRGRKDQAVEIETGNSKVFFRANGHHSEAQDYKDGSGQVWPSAWSKWNADFSIGVTPNADTTIELSAGAGDGHARYAGRSMDGAAFRRESWALRVEKRQIASWMSKLEAQVYSNHANHVMDNHSLRLDPPTGSIQRSVNVRRTTSGGRVAITLSPAQHWQLVTGVDTQRSPVDWRRGTPKAPYHENEWNPEAKLFNAGWFAEGSWQASQDTRWVTGMRLDHAEAQRHPAEAQDHRRKGALPSAFIRWEQQLDSRHQVYAGLGHVQRFPDYWELIPPGNSGSPDGNAFMTLRPEKTTQLDFGVQRKQETWQFWASGYVGWVQDYILFDRRGKSSAVRNVNASTAGYELGGQYQFNSKWTSQATLAGVWARNLTDGGALPQIPPSELRLGLIYSSGPWNAGALWRVVAAQPRVAPGLGNAVGKDFGTSPGFGVLSLHASYRVNQSFKLMLGIDNVFNKTYAEHLNLAGDPGFGFPSGVKINEPGRSAWVRADFRF